MLQHEFRSSGAPNEFCWVKMAKDWVFLHPKFQLVVRIDLGMLAILKDFLPLYFSIFFENKEDLTMTQKLLIVLAMIFCMVAAIVLIILYYPNDSLDKEFEVFDTSTPAFGQQEDWEYSDKDRSAEFRNHLTELARALEDFGAAFLALVAVCCVSVGLTCLLCAFCIFK
ncbi:hypothetical protein TNCT_214731 [Trichonephila clavata]|uniref:Uncharacterized protein n=1 Tax=Trichonephila clavata TaxID=2740835 RepID=A0A8X6LQB8_TRICU|nr:hypothetical protein TNCT_214731 [Trichonephila clavata]